MKVVGMDVLQSLPEGTVFTRYPLGLYEMLIKGPGATVQHLSDASGAGNEELFDIDMGITGNSFPLETDNPWADSDIAPGGLFVIYETADVNKVIERLTKALDDSTN